MDPSHTRSDISQPKVLIVDDEAGVLSACQRLLRNESYELAVTSSAEEALQWIARDSYAVVLSDQRMPSMAGTELLAKVRELSPDTVRIILTGYADAQAAVDAINRGSVYRFLTKPWDETDLRVTIRQAIGQYTLVTENRRLLELTQKQNLELKDLNQNLEQRVVERTNEISQLHQELERNFAETIQMLAGLTEMHSTVVGNHSKRVAARARDLGTQMGLTGPDLLELEIAAMLHDIGKISVPPEVLSKPESHLSPFEKEALRSHVVKGEAITKLLPHLHNVSRMIRHHHERMDGNGFPDRLQGTDIPLGSRIIAVANAFDKALNSRLIFESATTEKAFASVQSRCPEEFDPEIVSLLANCVQQKKKGYGEDAEVEIGIKDLHVGMVLARDLRTVRGVLLLAKNTEIQLKYLDHIRNFQSTDPVVDSIYVYRKRMDSVI